MVNEPHEALARTIHDNYVALELAKGKNPKTIYPLFLGGALPEAMREQIRLQADHFPVKLRAIGLAPDPLPDERAHRNDRTILERIAD